MSTGSIFPRTVVHGFPTTSWTLIRGIQGASQTKRRQLLEKLLTRYWKPIYAFYRAESKSRDDASDLTQAFLLHCLGKENLFDVEPREGSFRNWVKASARNFKIDQARKQRASKRRPQQGIVSFDGDVFEPAVEDKVDDVFEELWRRELLENALTSVWQLCQRNHRSIDYDVFQAYYLSGEENRPTWKQLAERFQLESWKQAARKADWVKSKLRQAIRQEILDYVGNEVDVDDELADLIA